jgi:hypothetical protein
MSGSWTRPDSSGCSTATEHRGGVPASSRWTLPTRCRRNRGDRPRRACSVDAGIQAGPGERGLYSVCVTHERAGWSRPSCAGGWTRPGAQDSDPSTRPSSVSVGCSLPARTPIACQYAEGRSSRQDLVGPRDSLGSRQIAACCGLGAFPPLIGQKTRSGPSRSPGEPRARLRCRRPVRVQARPDRRPWCGPCVNFRYVDRSRAAHAAGGGL